MIKIIVLVAFGFSYSFGAFCQGYVITGNIDGLPDEIEFYLVRSNEGRADTVARVKSQNSSFVFKGLLNLVGEHFYVKMDTSIVKVPEGSDSYVTLFLDNSNIQLSGSIRQWPEVVIEGSKLTKEYNEVVVGYKKFDSVVRIRSEAIKGTDEYLSNTRAAKLKWIITYVTSHPSSQVSAWLIYKLSIIMKPEEIELCFNKLDIDAKLSFYGLQLEARIPLLKQKSMIAIGKIIPNFYIETVDKKRVGILEIAKQYKYTLIDFWAWWCVPCRKDIPKMMKVYDDFHDKGFNIVSISTDPDKGKWKTAINEDATTWTHGIQIDDVSKHLFGIEALPAYILIDQRGEMIAQDCAISVFSSNPVIANKYVIKDLENRGLRKNLYDVIKELVSKELK